MARAKLPQQPTDDEMAQVKQQLISMATRIKLNVKGKQAKWLRAYAVSDSLNQAWKASGICYSNHYYWLKNDSVYADDYEMVESMRVSYLDSCVYARACTKDTLAAMFWLKSRNRDKYGDQVKTTNTSETNVNVNVNDMRAQLSAMVEQNPQLRAQLTSMLKLPIETTARVVHSEGGVCPQTETEGGGDIPTPTVQDEKAGSAQ